MKNIKKMRKIAKRKEKKIKPKKFEKKGTISRKIRMTNEILIVFIIAFLLIRKNCYYSI